MALAQAHRSRPPAVVAPAAAVAVREATGIDRAAWDGFVATHPGATGYHEWAWRGIFERAFGHAPVYLVAHRGHDIDGVLPLVDVRSLIFGRFMTSLPFVNYGGVLARTDPVAAALVETARTLSRERGCRHVELRHVARQFPHLPVLQHKVSMRLRLTRDMWDQLDRKARNQVRKAQKSGLTVERGGPTLLGDFYRVFARNMRDLGTPVYGRGFFDEILAAFPDRTSIVVVRRDREPLAAGLTYRTGRTVEVPWASSLREHNSLCPNHLLYWHAIETAAADGCETFDFGRSTPGGGTFRFKEQWGAEPVPLHWEYPHLAGGRVPDHGPTNPKFQAAIRAWKRCPVWIANLVGPRLVRGIP